MKTKFDLIYSNVSVLFGFCFRLNAFTSKISNLQSPLGAERLGECESRYTLFWFTFFAAFVLKHSVDEKNIQNIDFRIHVKLELQEIGC